MHRLANSQSRRLWGVLAVLIGMDATAAQAQTDPSAVKPAEEQKQSPASERPPAKLPVESSAADERTGWLSDLWTRKTLTGDWGGARTELEKKGITLQLYYNQQFQQNFRGGLDTHNGHRLSGSYDLNLILDFEKMGLLDDAGFFMRAAKGTWSDGINPNKVGALFNVNSDAGDDHPIFVNKWWFWKKFADEKVEIRLGLLQTNKDLFDVSPYANHEDKDFLNRGSIRNATIPHGNGIGVFGKYQPTSWLYTQAIAFDAQFQPRTTGFNSAFHDEPWFTAMWETGVTPKWPSSKGPLPGNLRAGLWYDPRPKTIYEDRLGGRRQPETQTGDWGYYFGADQLLWKENGDAKDTQGLGIFGRYGHAHSDRNRINHYWSVGGSYRGLVPTRDNDVTAFAVAQGILSDRYGEDVHPRADRETVYELYYAYQLTPWCIITPDLQFIVNPGGDKDDRDAIVGGVRVRITF